MSVMGKKIKQIREVGYRGRSSNVMVRMDVIVIDDDGDQEDIHASQEVRHDPATSGPPVGRS
jgi:hypothetical protein